MKIKAINSKLSSIIPLISIPQFFYIFFLLFIPFSGLIVYSFWKSDFFDIDRTFTLFNYYFILLEEHLYLFLIFKSFFIGFLVALVAIPIAFILAYILTFKFQRFSNLLLGIIMVSTLLLLLHLFIYFYLLLFYLFIPQCKILINK